MHFDFTITAGQVVLFIALAGLIWRIEVFSAWYMLEHELLIEWYCKEHSIKPHELMSRKMRYGILSIMKGRSNSAE